VVEKVLERMTKSALTDRENEVLQLLIEGYTNKQIAQQLQITVGTARSHVRSILKKLDASNRTEAVVRAHKRGLIRLQE
jgi:DNA-binding NarL/FixJ family response regulator